MKQLTIVLTLILLTSACTNAPSRLYYTTADSGLKGRVAEVELVEMPVVSPNELVLDSFRIAVYHKLTYVYGDNVLREVRVHNHSGNPVSTVTYSYDKDGMGRTRMGTQRNADGTVSSEIFLVSSTDSTMVTRTVSASDTTGIHITEKRDAQGRLLESRMVFSDGFLYTSQNSYNEDGERVLQVLTMSVDEFSRIASSYTYLSYDEQGNWTRALVEKRLENGETSYTLETRTIRYVE